MTIFRKDNRKGFPKNSCAWIQVLDGDPSLEGTNLVLVCPDGRQEFIKKHFAKRRALVRVYGAVDKIGRFPVLIAGSKDISAEFTSESVRLLLEKGFRFPADTLKFFEEQETANLYTVVRRMLDGEIPGVSPEVAVELASSLWYTEVSQLQQLFDDAGIGLDFDRTVQVYETLRHRADYHGTTVYGLIREIPWLVSQAEDVDFKAGVKLAEYLDLDNSCQRAVYAAAVGRVWAEARRGESYATLRQVMGSIKPAEQTYCDGHHTRYELVSLLIKHKDRGLFGAKAGQVAVETRTLSEQVAIDRMRCRLDAGQDKEEAERMAEEDAKAIYPVRVFHAEKFAVERLAALASRVVSDLKKKIGPETLQGLDLTQRLAVSTALKHPLCLWVGAAGSGKTHAMRRLVAALKEIGLKAAVLAPTAAAADRAGAGLNVPCGTIHRFAGIGQSAKDLMAEGISPGRLIEADFVIVDETSMCDIVAFAHLLGAVRDEVRLLLVGDPGQLPAVQASGFFQQIVRLRPERLPVVELTNNHRQGDALCDFARSIRGGAFPEPDGRSIELVEELSSDAVIEAVERLRAEGHGAKDICVLSPTRSGPMGTDMLQRLLRKIMNPPAGNSPVFEPGDPVLCWRNDYSDSFRRGFLKAVRHPERAEDIYNGYRGRVLLADESEIWVEFETPSGTRKVPYTVDEAPHWLEWAYALTVHKMQGGEANCVVLVAQSPADRALLYTAVTRAKERLILIGPRAFWEKAATKTSLPPRTKFTQRYVNLLADQLPPSGESAVVVF